MYFLYFIIAFGMTLQLLLVLRGLAPKIGLLDAPGGRKAHTGAIPLVGGLGMFIAFCFTLLMLDHPIGELRALLAGATLLVITGVMDDLHELSSSARFAVQIIASLMMVYWGGVELTDLGYLVSSDGLVELGWFSVPLTVFATVGVINALNMIDGVDGLAGSVTALTLVTLIVVASTAGDIGSSMVLGLLLAAIGGFLVLNLRFPWQPRARVFMGDAGSMFLGLMLAWFLIDFSQGEQRLISPATALWLLGVPLIDTVTMMLRRMLKRRSPFEPDREHFHHVLMLAGFSPLKTMLIMVVGSATMAIIGLAGHYQGVPEWVMFYGFLLVFAAYFLMIQYAWKVMRFLKHSINRRQGERRLANQTFQGPDRRSGADRRARDKR